MNNAQKKERSNIQKKATILGVWEKQKQLLHSNKKQKRQGKKIRKYIYIQARFKKKYTQSLTSYLWGGCLHDADGTEAVNNKQLKLNEHDPSSHRAPTRIYYFF
eukprot:TRINITY_DN15164_c0_g1_i7.p5 TRINITY_DN15164_c0_g1~~TRINITY_DN15164_c0_g1_i7.p5  ORF type:complete len:104 (+),score=9.36 TRINITY_DN15164_c0_g1_i7:355-666(+)